MLKEVSKPFYQELATAAARLARELKFGTHSDGKSLLFVGASTQLPGLTDLLREHEGLKGAEHIPSLGQEAPIVLGAATTSRIALGGFPESQMENNVLLMDVLPLSLNVKLPDGRPLTVIERNTPIPTRKTVSFETQGSARVLLQILEHTRCLEELEMWLPDESRRLIEVTIDVDENGVIEVTATDTETTTKKVMIANDKGRSTKEEIDSIILEAPSFQVAESDMRVMYSAAAS